jgi:CheY-like chemotaxis protein
MSAGLNVLIVDDSEDLRELLSMVIERHPAGWRVVATASEGQQGIEEARASQPDLVLLDIAMPVMDGLEATRRISRLGIPVVVLTGSRSRGGDAVTAGAHAMVVKSDATTVLAPVLRAVVASS